MNPKQIADLYRQDDWGKCTSNKVDVWFEVLEEYVYDTELGPIITIPKGTRMKFTHRSIKAYHFEFDKNQNLRLPNIGFGRSRLLKLKLIELKIIHLNEKQIRELKGCPNCNNTDIKLKSLNVPEHPIPQFRKQHFYECQNCGYWTGIIDKYNWYPPPLSK